MKVIFAAAALGLAGMPALAQEFSAGAGLTSLGPAIEGSYMLNDQFTARAQIIGGVSVSGTETAEIDGSDYDIDGDGSFGGVALLGDYYPTASGWRVSGGLFISNTNLEAAFTGPQTFDAEIAFKREVAPMITTGYKFNLGNSWHLSTDAGVIISELEAVTDSTDPDVLDEVASINDDLSEIPVVPHLSLTVGYQW